jgi:hypothetical protein
MSVDIAEPEPKRTCIRGLYDTTDDNVAPEVDNSMFKEVPHRMLRFSTKADCKAFMLKHCKVGSNPQFPYLQHMFTLLVTWEQVQTYLLDKVNMIYCVVHVMFYLQSVWLVQYEKQHRSIGLLSAD